MLITGLAAKVSIELEQLGINAGHLEHALKQSIRQGIEPVISEFVSEQFMLLSGASKVSR
jgi:hypothetical protein